MVAKCNYCGQRAAIEIRGKGPHKGEYCSNCGHWLRWIPKKVAKIGRASCREKAETLSGRGRSQQLGRMGEYAVMAQLLARSWVSNVYSPAADTGVHLS